MGSYEPPILVDKSLCGLPSVSGCLLPVGTVGDLGNSLGNIGGVSSGLVDQCRDCKGSEIAVLERGSRLEPGFQLLNCNGGSMGQPVIEQFCSEVACPLSNNHGDTGFPSLTQNCCGNSLDSVGPETTIFGRDGPENRHEDMILLISNQIGQKGCGFNESGTGGSYLERGRLHCENGFGKYAENGHMSLASSLLDVYMSKNTKREEQKVAEDVNGFSVESVTDLQEVVEEKHDVLVETLVGLSTQASLTEDNTCNLVEGSPNVASDCGVGEEVSQQSSQPFGVVNVISSKSLVVPYLQETGQMDNEGTDDAKSNHVSLSSDPSEETVTDLQEDVKEKCDALAGKSVILSSPESHIGQDTHNLIDGSLNVASDCAVEESASLQLSHPFDVVDIGSSKSFAVPDIQERDALSSVLTCSSVVDSTGQKDNDGKDKANPSFVSTSNCPDIVHVFLRRSTRVSKLSQMTETRKASSNCRRTANSVLLPDGTVGISLKTARRKRSYSCKPARSSTWGMLGNIIQVFKQNDGILKHESDLIQVRSLGSRKARVRQGSEKQKKTRAGGNSQESNGKRCASNNRVRLTVKMGEKVGKKTLKPVPPKVVDSLASVQTVVNECLPDSNYQTGLEVPKVAIDAEVENKPGEYLLGIRQFHCLNRNLEKPITSLDVSELDAQFVSKDLASIVTQDLSVGNSAGDCHGVSSQTVTEVSAEAVDNGYLDPGTSPHSEVINLSQNVQVTASVQLYLHDGVLDSAQAVVAPEDHTASNMPPMKTKKGKENGKAKGSLCTLERNCLVEEKLHGTAKMNNTRKSIKRRSRQKVGDGLNPSEVVVSATSQNTSGNTSSSEGLAREPLPLSGVVELGFCQEALKMETGMESCEFSRDDVGIRSSESWTSEGSLSAAKTKGHTLPRTSKSNARVSKSKTRVPNSVRCRRENARERNDGLSKSFRSCKVKEGHLDHVVVCQRENHLEADFNVVAIGICDNLARNNAGNKVASEDVSSSSIVSNGFEEQSLPPRIAWVRCDDCHKWRCISAVLADVIDETNCKWTCKDNTDKAFADCSIPQEKSNADINAELQISDASCEEDAYDARSNSKGFERRQLSVPQQASWTLIKSNMFLHRSRKSQIIDEIMVCHCKPPLDGSLGCRDECLNRMLNIECVKGTCPCGDHCSNQQFQKRKYADFKWFRCGKKGYGLQLLENVSQGQFLIEYVGEVLDLHAYEVRQREYASRGQKHFYFMTLNGSEVIDACAKGNLGRFINHSCEPNCRTEKWMVNGEVCIGLFAVRDIKKGEEVTFDYNYVRVFGAAAKKCVCGSSGCRGYIGGDPSNTETIVQGDSDEEYPEPVMIDENGYNERNMYAKISASASVDGAAVEHAKLSLKARNVISRSDPVTLKSENSLEKKNNVSGSLSAVRSSEFSLKMEDSMSKSLPSVQPLEVSLQTEESMNKTSSAVQSLEVSLQKEESMNKFLCTVQTIETSPITASSMRKSISNLVGANKSRSDTIEDKPNISKSRSLIKASRSSGSTKKGKCSVPMITNKTQAITNKPKKLLDDAARGRFEGVEEKLNELLDTDGGISKRKDASKGYLKLLVVTAASGDSCSGEAFQSARDLSIILDALMKTKSRTVLVDIVSKNGLQMLHNILKQNRRDFNKIPVLRKLLKVLEFLALKGILTVEHITGGPPHPGMESFRDSIFELTRHSDVQVHQIARSFRDRWFSRSNRRIIFSDRDDSKMELESAPNCKFFSSSHKHWHDQGVRLTEAISCMSQSMLAATPLDANALEDNSAPSIGRYLPNGARTRKRKSRWDQPAETKADIQLCQCIEERKVEPSSKQKLEQSSQQAEISEVVQDQVIEVNREKKSCDGCVRNLFGQDEAAARVEVMKHIQEDAPPGFPSPLNKPPVPFNACTTDTISLPPQVTSPSSHGSEVIKGHPQERYLPCLPMSYGIPLFLVQQLGTPQETDDCWTVAPGIPFHPFPPLPPLPHDKSNPLPSSSAAKSKVMDGYEEELQQANHHVAAHHMDSSIPSTSGVRPPDVFTSENNQQIVERVRSSSHGLGRRYFRQQKWNTHNYGPPWLRRRNGWGYKGNNSRNGVYSVGLGNVGNELRGICCSEGISSGSDSVSSTCYQHAKHQYQH